MYLLPQMCAENLNQRYLERRDLAMEKDACQIKLHLETNIDIRTINLVDVSSYLKCLQSGICRLLDGDEEY